MDTDKLIILNEIERPCMHLICKETDSKIYYVNKILRKDYPKLRKSYGWASLTDYGFVFENKKFTLKHDSKVKYDDGKTRHWQGRTSFTYTDILNASKWDD